jgi:glucose-1-phosphate adenylyltransferase
MTTEVLTLILAGGKGTRLDPLTRDRAKPAVPIGGLYRIIDFTLSNCINSNLRRILVLTQYKARSLDRHIHSGWSFLSRELGEYIEVLPPQQRIDEHWYKGTTDAIYQNIYSIEKADPRYVLILAGDHIYKMDYSAMIAAHVKSGSDLTVGCIPVPLSDGPNFGIMQVDDSDHIVRFQEKPRDPVPMPDSPGMCSVRMRPGPAATMTSARTSSRASSTSKKRSATGFATATARPFRTGATWAPWMPITRPTWT